MLELAILLGATGVVYALAWGLAWLIARFLPLPDRYRSVLPWFLFQVYLVVGLFLTGDLPGAPRATLRLATLAGGLSLVFGLMAHLRRRGREPWTTTVNTWIAAGMLPWLLTLVAEAVI